MSNANQAGYLKDILAALGGSYGGFYGAVALTPGTPVTPARGLAIICTVAGNVQLKFADDSTLVIPVAVGLSVLEGWSIKDIVAGGTTATATYAVLK